VNADTTLRDALLLLAIAGCILAAAWVQTPGVCV
jgi:hypothetical protein